MSGTRLVMSRFSVGLNYMRCRCGWSTSYSATPTLQQLYDDALGHECSWISMTSPTEELRPLYSGSTATFNGPLTFPRGEAENAPCPRCGGTAGGHTYRCKEQERRAEANVEELEEKLRDREHEIRMLRARLAGRPGQ